MTVGRQRLVVKRGPGRGGDWTLLSRQTAAHTASTAGPRRASNRRLAAGPSGPGSSMGRRTSRCGRPGRHRPVAPCDPGRLRRPTTGSSRQRLFVDARGQEVRGEILTVADALARGPSSSGWRWAGRAVRHPLPPSPRVAPELGEGRQLEIALGDARCASRPRAPRLSIDGSSTSGPRGRASARQTADAGCFRAEVSSIRGRLHLVLRLRIAEAPSAVRAGAHRRPHPGPGSPMSEPISSTSAVRCCPCPTRPASSIWRALAAGRRRARLDRRHAARCRRRGRGREVADLTGFPEMLDGRVKTLHPRRSTPASSRCASPPKPPRSTGHGIPPIDLLVVTLYPFEETVASGADFATCVENIDIGGPALIRAAAKNHDAVAVVVDPGGLRPRSRRHRAHDGATVSPSARARARAEGLRPHAAYDAAISTWLGARSSQAAAGFPRAVAGARRSTSLRREPPPEGGILPSSVIPPGSIATARQLQGKELSYNNIADTDAALECVKELGEGRPRASSSSTRIPAAPPRRRA